MLEGLPPNNAAHKLRLVCDEARARAVADLIVESFEPAEAASTAFETEDALAGRRQGVAGRGLFRLRSRTRRLCANSSPSPPGRTRRGASNSASRKSATGSPIRSPDWRRCAPGAFSSMARTTARASAPATSASRSRRASPSAPAITARRAAACCISIALLKRRRPRNVLDVGCGAGVLAIAAAKVLKRKVWLGDIDPVAVASRQRKRAPQRRRRLLQGDRLARRREPRTCATARPTISSSPTSSPSRCACSRPRSPP